MEKNLEQRVVELEKKVAELEGQVPAQPIELEEVIQNQITTLQLVQKECLERKNFQHIEPTNKAILEAVTLLKNMRP